jgi:hypothetical protein
MTTPDEHQIDPRLGYPTVDEGIVLGSETNAEDVPVTTPDDR